MRERWRRRSSERRVAGNGARQELRKQRAALPDGIGNGLARDEAARPNDDVELLDRRPGSAHAFPQTPAESVAIHRARHGLPPDHVADATGILRSGRGNQLEEMSVEPNTDPKNRFESGCAPQTMARAPLECNAGLGQTDRRARPLARRAASTLRPPTVLMRARNPWVRARRNFDGWYVRFMMET
jgi:hypothetical protein